MMVVLRAPLGSLLKKTLIQRSTLFSQLSKSHNYGNTPTVKLCNGGEIPALGLGTWKSCPAEVCAAVQNAICIGYRHIDCGHVHENEKEVGMGIKAKIDDGTICRSNIFVTSKLWNTYHGGYEIVKQGLERTLTDLCIPYVDLYLMQWPLAYKCGAELFPKDTCGSGGAALNLDVHFSCVWKEMERLQKNGLTRMIGVSNFNANHVERLLATAEIPPAVNQIELHPYLNQVQLSSFCTEKHVNVIAHSPLGSPGTPRGTAGPLFDPAVQCIANTHHKCPAQILIRYQIQRGHIVIPKSVCLEHITQNFSVFDFCLSDLEMNQLMALEKGKNGRIVIECDAMAHPEYPFKELLCA